MKYPKILFFIDGPSPSLAEMTAAEELAPSRIMFRNAKRVDETAFVSKEVMVNGEPVTKHYGSFELCDGVHGDATPKAYGNKYPTAAQALAKFKVDRKDAHEKLAATATEQENQAAARRMASATADVDKAHKAAEAVQAATTRAEDNLARVAGGQAAPVQTETPSAQPPAASQEPPVIETASAGSDDKVTEADTAAAANVWAST